MTDQPELECIVEQQYARWRAAMSARDAVWFEEVLDPGFLYTGSEGQRKTKADHIAQVTSAVESSFATQLRTVDRHGDIVVVTGDHWAKAIVDRDRARIPETIARKMAAGITYAFTSVWSMHGQTLRLLAHHTSELAQPSSRTQGGADPDDPISDI